MSKVQSIVEELKNLSLLEAAELVKEIETTFGVSAAAPVAVAGPAASAEAAPAAEEKSEFDVVVESVPADKKIAIIKIVKEVLAIGLGDAKTKVESAPFSLGVFKTEDANKHKDALSGSGAVVTLK